MEAGLDQVEHRAKQLHASLATLSSGEARGAAVAALKRQGKEIEGMFSEDETKKFVSGGVASYVHGLERALEAGPPSRPDSPHSPRVSVSSAQSC